jgi:cyclic-di-AMP phosphodiesterase PgpH
LIEKERTNIKKLFSKDNWLKILCITGSFALCCMIALVSTAPETHNITQGQISNETITAPRDFVDQDATKKLQDEEKAKIGPVYKLDSNVTQSSLNALAADFGKFESARAYSQQVYVTAQISQLQAAENQRVQSELQNSASAGIQSSVAATPKPTPKTITAADVPFDPANINWSATIPQEEQTKIQGMLPTYLDSSDWLNVVGMTKDSLSAFYSQVYNQCRQEMATGFKEEQSSETVSSIVLEATRQLNLPAQVSRLATECLQQDIQANYVFDQQATQLQQEAAANGVKPVTYMKGQNIVVRGEIVSAEAYNVLTQMGLLDQPESQIDFTLSTVLYLVLLFVFYIVYAANFEKKLSVNTKHVAILSILTVLVMGLTAILARVAPNLLVTYMVVILAAVLISTRSAVSFGAFVSLLIVTVLTSKQAFFTESAFTQVVVSVTGGIFAAALLRKVSQRATLILAGLLASVPGVVFQMILWKANMVASSAVLVNMAWTTAGGVISGIVAVGLLPALENIFKITTPAKLLELSDPNHPLLKRLLMEAPGTYHHSLYVGNLAEAACEAVGANALLARVGAYYHDVGKLKNPRYFVENQRNNVNPHDNMEPGESAQMIMGHVDAGMELLSKYNLPTEIKKIVQQHHGNTPVAFFYHKAKNSENGADINDFRYPCPRPDTKESAIVMLADTVEAAVRTLDDPGDKELLAFIQKLIRDKYDDGQLDLTPLTRRDITMIGQAFAGVYSGMIHTRIKYPRLNLDGDKDENNSVRE